jgi:hypothetical protein
MTLIRAAASLAALALAACAPSAEQTKALSDLNTCKISVASQYPDTPGQVGADAQHIEDVGNGMEKCMTGFGYKYDDGKPGCQSPPDYDARHYWLRSHAECYSLVSAGGATSP